MKQIRFFHADREEFGWLSNFYPAPFRDNEYRFNWNTVEHYFQASKTEDPEQKWRITHALTPKEAKKLGRVCNLRADWEDVKEDVMAQALAYKFWQNSDLLAKLMLTGDAELIEDSPYDSYWGAGKDGKGKNRLGVLLMALRDDVQEKFSLEGIEQYSTKDHPNLGWYMVVSRQLARYGMVPYGYDPGISFRWTEAGNSRRGELDGPELRLVVRLLKELDKLPADFPEEPSILQK